MRDFMKRWLTNALIIFIPFVVISIVMAVAFALAALVELVIGPSAAIVTFAATFLGGLIGAVSGMMTYLDHHG